MFILGMCFGSFGSVLIERNPSGRSICLQCKKTLGPGELIPIVSFLALGGRCKGCKGKISLLYPSLELAGGILFLYAYIITGAVIPTLTLALTLWLLLTIALIDMRTHTISDAHNIPLIVLAFGYQISLGMFEWTGAVLGAAFFAVLWTLSRGKWIGSGDILLGAGIGALLGPWQMMAACLLITYVVGALIASVLLLTGKVKRGDYVPFAPFLALGTLLTLVFRDRIILLITLYI